ncbi:MAG: hypothetical protein B7Z82_05890, partial [Halothiobacillus sp. 20-54-6]
MSARSTHIGPLIAHLSTRKKSRLLIGSIGMVLGISGAQAADWSDTSLSWRYGTKFAEPYEG